MKKKQVAGPAITSQAKEQKRRARKYETLWMTIYDDLTDHSAIPLQRLVVTAKTVRRMTPGDTIENFCKVRKNIDLALELFRKGDSKF